MSRILVFLRKRVLLVTFLLILVFLIPISLLFLSSYVEGAGFHKALEKATSHGLHLDAHWDQIEHVGLFGLATDSFHGDNGQRSIQSIQAQNITANFEPMGVFYGRWDVGDIVIDSAEVRLQKVGGQQSPNPQTGTAPASQAAPPSTQGPAPDQPSVAALPVTPLPATPTPVVVNTGLPTEQAPVATAASPSPAPVVSTEPNRNSPSPTPGTDSSAPSPSPSPSQPPPDPPVPWYAFWPHRVSLRHVLVKEGNVIMTMRGQDGGVYGSEVVMTPNGRDYEYDFHDGEMRLPGFPVLHISHGHALVTKPMLTINELLLDEGPETPDHLLRIEGTSGLKEDKTVHATMSWNNLSLEKWLPPTFQPRLSGLMKGNMEYSSPEFAISEKSSGKGNLEFDGVTLPALGFVEQYSSYTGSPDPGSMPLKQAQADVALAGGVLTLSNLAIESEGVFRLEGTVSVNVKHELSGNVQLGLAGAYIRWLPSARQHIFTDERLGYSFANVHVSGTVEQPKEDLSRRVVEEVKHNPLLALKLLFHKMTH